MTETQTGVRTVGFLGPRGTFTEGAARRYAAPSDRLVPFDTIPELLRAAARGDVDRAVAPVENSIEGTVNVTLDSLVHDVDLTVVADVVLPIRHHLLVGPGVSWRDVAVVVSHPQALAQCRRWLDAHLPGVHVEAAFSTAAAAAKAGEVPASQDGRPMAAIGNEMSARLYGLHVAVEDIQDESLNETRFFVVGRPQGVDGSAEKATNNPDPQESGSGCKTSIAFAFAADGPGNLYGALGQFARRNVNLTKLESRPARQALGHYIFFVDLEGRAADGPVADALAALEQECTFFKVLGTYPTLRTNP